MGGIHVWETVKESIVAYTGLPPTTFFTLLALVFAFYYVVSDLFGSSSNNRPHQPSNSETDEEEELPPLKPPVQLGDITEEELKLYDGSNPEKPLLMAIKGHIYDVSQSRMFYGPGGPYALFAGKDASRALAKMSFEEKDLTGDISGLGPFELEALQDWEYKFMEKYAKVGTIKSVVPVTNAESTVEPSESTTPDVDVKPTEDGQSETAAVNHDVDDVKPTRVVDDVKPTEDGQSETAAVKHDFDDVKPTHVVADVKPTEDSQSETTAVKHDETASNVDHHQTPHFKEEELRLYDGSDPEKPLLMAIKGQIYDVSQSRMIYGPDGPYALFAGKDASRALAKMSFEEEDLTGDISGLGPSELEALQNWENKFMEKYAKVGTIKV